MIEDLERTDFIEAERYELFAAPEYNFHFDASSSKLLDSVFFSSYLPLALLPRNAIRKRRAAKDQTTTYRTMLEPGFTSMKRAA